MLDQDRPRPSSSKPPSKKKKVEQEDNKMERPPPPTPWGSRVPSPCPSRAPSEKNKVEQVEDKKTKQKEDTEKSGVKASVCLDSDTPDDEEQNEKDMAVDHRQKEGDEKNKKNEQVEQEKDQRTKVVKDKDLPEAMQKREALCWILRRETWIVRSSEYHAIEQAQFSGYATEQTQSHRHAEDCGNIVFDTIASVTFFEQTFYDQPALLLHKQMWDIMSRNKEGLAKENMFIECCRRVQRHNEAVPSSDTEHIFNSLALDLLSNDLTPEQRYGAAYKVIKDKKTGAISVTTKQRSWINVILRKNLGHSRVAYYIFNHGVPALFNLPFRREAPSIREHHHRKQLGRNWEDARCSDLRVPQQ